MYPGKMRSPQSLIRLVIWLTWHMTCTCGQETLQKTWQRVHNAKSPVSLESLSRLARQNSDLVAETISSKLHEAL